MNGEIDLELYTVSLIRLNNAFQKLDDDDDSAISMFADSADDLKDFFTDCVSDLNLEEVNYGDYELFFKNTKNSFPQYINILKETLENNDNDEVKHSLESLINTFTNLNKIAEGMLQ